MSCTKETARCATATSYMHNLPACCRSHLVSMMADIKTLFDAAGITWWMDYGTLLGAVRNPLRGEEPGILGHDKDADICIMEPDAVKLAEMVDWNRGSGGLRPQGVLVGPQSGPLNIVRKLPREKPRNPRETDEQYRERVKYTAGCSWKVRWSAVNHTNIDIFEHKTRDDGTMYRERYISVDKYKGREFPRDKLFPLIRLPWEGLMLPAPADPEWFCEMRYGKGWREPLRANNDKVPKHDDGSVAGERKPMVG